MITLEDCVAFCGLTEEEVLAIAEHEHMPEIAAAALAEYLTYQEHGWEKIRDMIVDDIRASQARNDKKHVLNPSPRAPPFSENASPGTATTESLE